MTQSTPTLLLPYIDQAPVYNLMDHQLTYSQMSTKTTPYTVSLLHADAMGAVYNDPDYPNTVLAAKTSINSFLCPSTPVATGQRNPDGFGAWDYMFCAVCDVEDGTVAGATDPLGTRPTTTARRITMSQKGALSCDKNWGFGAIVDGTSNTISVCRRCRPVSPERGCVRFSVQPSVPDSRRSRLDRRASNGRRMYAWADPDAGTNGVSGPSNSLASKVLSINNFKTPIGGPAECRWTNNNCGPNDEIFSFHTGGAQVVLADGSVRFLSENLDWLVLKRLVGSQDGFVVGEF